MKHFIGIDLGGTNVKGIIIDQNGEIIKQHYIPTLDAGDSTWRVNVLEMVFYLKNWLQSPIMAVGMSAPGLPDEKNTCIAYLPNRLSGLENFAWGNYLGETTFVINDAHSAIMAESSFGVARNYQNVLLLTLGTGVGGGLLINGQLYQGMSQMAGHLGHLTINANDDETSIVGMVGSLEYAIGNYSVQKRSKNKFESTWELVEAYRKNDAWATLVWLSSIQKLAIALSSLINIFSPQLIVLSGGITLADNDLFEPLSQYMALYEWRPGGKQTPIVQAHFGDMAGAIGAAGFAMKRVGEG